MKHRTNFQLLGLLTLTCAVGCGGGATNTVKTKEDAAKILSAASTAQSKVTGGGEASCDGGGKVSAKTSIGGDLLKGEISTTTEISFSGCVSAGVTLNGSWSQITTVSSSTPTLSNTGHIETSLGSCIIDMKGTTVSAAVTGMFCGFDYNTLG
jgi:hypothetical protein